MARTALLAALLIICIALGEASFFKMTLEARTQPGLRRDKHRRYYEDPLGLAGTIYSTILTVGGQNYRVIMDTGSATVFLIGRNCTQENTGQGCTFASNFYEGSGSTFAYSSNQCSSSINYGTHIGVCGLSALYGDGSYVNAVGIQETATIGPFSGPIKFGMAYNTSTGFILTGTDGIWGLGRYLPNDWVGVPGPFHAATQAGLPPQFATCFHQNGGELHLGGFDLSFSSRGISWYNWDTSAFHYEVPLTQITVNGNTVGYTASSGKPIFDTGSTVSYIPSTVFNNMLTQVTTYCSSCQTDIFTSGVFRTLNPDDYPNITLSFTDTSSNVVQYELSARQYLVPHPDDPNQWAGGFTEDTSSSPSWLFGVSFMKNWYTIFDVGNNRLGLGDIDSVKCSAELPPVAPLTEITPGTVKPPASSGGLTPFAGSPVSFPPVVPPTSTPTGAPSSSPDPAAATPDSPSGSATSSASISLFLLGLLALFALLF